MSPAPLQLRTPIDLPAQGSSVRVAMGGSVLVLEAVRGAYTLLWHGGPTTRKYVLGVPRDGSLALELRAPRYAVRLLVVETVTLAPGARVHGYVQVPLIPTVVFSRGGVREDLLELTPNELATEWVEDHALHCCTSPWFTRFPVHADVPRVTVPLRLRNDEEASCSPECVQLHLQNERMSELRFGIVAEPVRLRWDEAAWMAENRYEVTS